MHIEASHRFWKRLKMMIDSRGHFVIVIFFAIASTTSTTAAFVPLTVVSSFNRVGSGGRTLICHQTAATRSTTIICATNSDPNERDDDDDDEKKEWTSDFDDFVGLESSVFFDPNENLTTKSSSSTKSDKQDNQDTPIVTSSSSIRNLDRAIEVDNDEKAKDSLAASFSKAVQQQQQVMIDKSACRTRQFSLGADFILTNYVGSLGFDEVTDWEYYLSTQDEDGNIIDDNRRQVVQPNPFDKNQPRRTRSSSGSVVRIFRGEFVGPLGGSLSANGLDRRLLIKEFSGGDLAFALAQAELETLAKLQSSSDFFPKDNDKDWIGPASSRSIRSRQDNANILYLMEKLRKASFTGILGEVNLAELQDDLDANEFYRAMGVTPPTLSDNKDDSSSSSSNAIWLVYEYAGLQSLQAYCLQPPATRRANMPRQKGFFGNFVEPPPLPSFESRSQYVVRGIIKGCIEALATLHDAGIVHRSIGRSSIILSNSKTLDKAAASSLFATLGNTAGLQVKLTDFGFSGPHQDSTRDEEFRNRARSYKLYFSKGENTILTTNFAIAEDMHALGFVFLGLLLTSLADIPQSWNPKEQAILPATDEDSLQRLLGEIFDKDVKGQFRDYVEAEECWANVVRLLDDKNGAGWTILETLLCAREKVAANRDATQILSVRGLLSNPFFN